MPEGHSPIEHKLIPLNADGELTEGKFCVYCGTLNTSQADYCGDCREYIADQGPDLPARLARISRRASGIQLASGGLIGADSKRNFWFIKHRSDRRLFWPFYVVILFFLLLLIILSAQFIATFIGGH